MSSFELLIPTAETASWKQAFWDALRDLPQVMVDDEAALEAAKLACIMRMQSKGENQQDLAAYHARLLQRDGDLRAVQEYAAAVRAVTTADLLALIELNYDEPLFELAIVDSQPGSVDTSTEDTPAVLPGADSPTTTAPETASASLPTPTDSEAVGEVAPSRQAETAQPESVVPAPDTAAGTP